MKFPIDVTNSKETKVSLYKNSKAFLAYGILIAVTIGSMFLTTPYLMMLLGFNFHMSLILHIAFFIFAAIQIFRYMVFDERKKVREEKSSKGYNISRYWKIRKDSAVQIKSKMYEREYTAMEMTNGSMFFVLQIKHGGIKKNSAIKNKDYLNKLINQIMKEKLMFQMIIMDEPYYRNPFFDRITARVGRYENKKFVRLMLNIYDFIKDIVREQGSVPTEYIIVRTTQMSQRYILDTIIDNIVTTEKSFQYDFRDVSILDEKEIIEFVRDYFQLEILDLSMLDLRQNFTDNSIGISRVAEITDNLGKVYEINEFPVSLKTKAKQARIEEIKDSEKEEIDDFTKVRMGIRGMEIE